MKHESTRRILLKLVLSLVALLVLVSAGPPNRLGASRDDSGVCTSQCHMDMSDCLGNGGGQSCMDAFGECNARCYQELQ